MSQYPDEEVTLFVWRHWGGGHPPHRHFIRFLDLGCGQGATTWFLAREGYGTTAIDGSPAALRHTARRLAREGLSAQLVQGDITQLPFPDGTFHCVLDVMSSCCGPGPWRALGEVHRVLVPGGLVFSRLPRVLRGAGAMGDMVSCTIRPNHLFRKFTRTAVGLTTRHSDDAHLEHWDVVAQK